MQLSPSEHWGFEDKNSDTPVDCPNSNKEALTQSDPQQRFEDTTQGSDLQPHMNPETKPKANLNKTGTANSTQKPGFPREHE
jgi:hypothetical protein